MKVLKYRNAESKSADNSIIDLEIETDLYGWIPTTIHPNDNDQEEHVIQIKQWLIDNANLIAAYVPYVPTQAEIDAQALGDFKASRTLAVSQIVVISASGKSFDGDETSQNRMARAVTSSNAGDTTQWVLADTTVATVTHEELKEALRLAGEAMTAIWVS